MWNFRKYGEKTALLDEKDRAVSYKDLMEIEEKIGTIIKGKSLIFILCTNQIPSVVGYAVFLNLKSTPVLLNADLEKEFLDRLIQIYKPAYLWVLEKLQKQYEDMSVVFQWYGYSLCKTKFGKVYPIDEELALMLTTSGSTGSPKFVRQSYHNIRVNTESIVEYLEIDETERAITTLPMNYTYGLSIIHTHLYTGATILLTNFSIIQKEFWEFFKKGEATSFGGVPYTYEMLDRLRFYRMDLPSLRYMTQAGGKLSLELHEKFARYALEKEKKFIVMYGQCEATARMAYLPADYALKKKGSMGIAIPGGKLYLADENKKQIETPWTTGELIYQGENVTLGYAECGEDLRKGDERGGILETGDMAQFDEDGFYYMVGRKKRFLKVFGNRINLDEIDGMIKEKFGNIQCAIAGEDDHIYIFITDDWRAEKIKQYVIEKIKINHMAFHVIVLKELPKNDAGKIRYKELEKYFYHQ